MQVSNLRQQGFTLIEIMIALFVFTIGILGVVVMQLRAIHGNASAQRLTEASIQAQEVVERIVEQPYATFAPPAPSPIITNVGPYTVTQTVAIAPAGSAIAGALFITVTVQWTEPGGNVRTVPVSFIKSQQLEKSYGS